VRDVGGKGFGCVDPLAQSLSHVGDGARQHPDLVVAVGQARHDDVA